MYVYSVEGDIIETNKIVGIFDIDKVTTKKATRQVLKRAEKEKKLISNSKEVPCACLLTEDGYIFFSSLSVATLVKRATN